VLNTINNSKKLITKYIFYITLASIGFSIFASFGVLPHTVNLFSTEYAEYKGPKEDLVLDTFKSDVLENIGNKEAFTKERKKSYMNFLYSISSTWGDSSAYIEMVINSNQYMISPYKYRILTPFLAKPIYYLLNFLKPSNDRSTNAIYSIFAVNVFFYFCTGFLFYIFLYHILKFNIFISFIGTILYFIGTPIFEMLHFPLVDLGSLFFSLLIFYSIKKNNKLLFLITSSLGIFAKEILIFSSLAYFIEYFKFKLNKENIQTLLISCFPVFVFIIQHKIFGGAAIEANYGYNLLKLEIPGYALNRLSNIKTVGIFFINIFITFNFIWLGLLNIKKNDFLTRQMFFIGFFVMLAIFFFSSRIDRILYIIFPIIIPLYLRFFKANY
jgi:hypothetical protein